MMPSTTRAAVSLAAVAVALLIGGRILLAAFNFAKHIKNSYYRDTDTGNRA